MPGRQKRPNVPVSLDRNFAFVHIPKSGGSSIMAAFRSAGIDFEFEGNGLWDRLERLSNGPAVLRQLKEIFPINTVVHFAEKHLPARILREFISPDVWSRLFTFAVVRNPWDLVVSTYFYIRENSQDFDLLEPDYSHIISHCDFANFVRMYPMIASDQCTMIEDEAGEVMLRFVGRFERLNDDFEDACHRIGVHVRLPHVNASAHARYREYYDDETRAVIARHFERDIERFGYAF